MQNALIHAQHQALEAFDISTMVSDWYASLNLRVDTGELAKNTSATYKRGWNKFAGWLDTQDVGTITADIIRTWIAELKAEGYTPSTVNAWYAGVRAFYGWLSTDRGLLVNPTQGVKGARRKGTMTTHKRDSLTDNETLRVLAFYTTQEAQDARNRAMLYLMAFTALRSVEIARADLEDLKTESGRTVLYVQGKGHEEKDTPVIIPQGAQDALYDWLATRAEQAGPLFMAVKGKCKGERLSTRTIRRIVKTAFRGVGIHGKEKTTHSLRHTAITNAIRNGAPIQKVRAMARHASIETTMIYYHEIDRLENPAEDFVNYQQIN